jgi:hypothetical protein
VPQLESRKNSLEIELNEKLRRRRLEIQTKLESLGEVDGIETPSIDSLEARTRELRKLDNSIATLQEKTRGMWSSPSLVPVHALKPSSKTWMTRQKTTPKNFRICELRWRNSRINSLRTVVVLQGNKSTQNDILQSDKCCTVARTNVTATFEIWAFCRRKLSTSTPGIN